MKADEMFKLPAVLLFGIAILGCSKDKTPTPSYALQFDGVY